MCVLLIEVYWCLLVLRTVVVRTTSSYGRYDPNSHVRIRMSDFSAYNIIYPVVVGTLYCLLSLCFFVGKFTMARLSWFF